MKYAALEEIATEHLQLRKFCISDAELYYKRIAGSHAVTKYMLWQPHQSIAESRASIQKILEKYRSGTGYCWAIALAEDNSVIGRIDLVRFDEARSCCSFAYMLGEEFWGQGYATEALKAVFTFAFEKMQLQEISADHMCENVASGKVMQKAGMVYVDTALSKYEKDGRLHDADAYRITARQWRPVK